MPEAAQITELAVTWAAVARGSAGAAAQRHSAIYPRNVSASLCSQREQNSGWG